MLTLALFLVFIIIKCILGLVFCVAIAIVIVRLFLEPNKGLCKCKTELHGKVALITGGNSGIGLETAKDLARRGARVIIASRDERKSEEAVAMIKQTTGNNNIEHRVLNLANKSSILEFSKKFNKDFDRLDILVNNAGCSAVKKCKTEDGIDLLMQINYVGPFMLTNLLLDKLKASKPSRIVNVSSQVHWIARLNPDEITNCNITAWFFLKYSKTKLCVLLWTRALAKRLLPDGVTVNTLHPGVVKTNIFRKWNPCVKLATYLIIDLLFRTPLEGAQTIIHLCVSPTLKNSSGGYYRDFKEMKPSGTARNDDLAEKLWNKTMSLVGA